MSAEAVGYAFMQAAERGTGLTVVHAWQADPVEESIGYAASDAFRYVRIERAQVTGRRFVVTAASPTIHA